MGLDLEQEFQGPLESLRQFVLAGESFRSTPPEDKRSTENGLKILQKYFKTYANDGLMIALDSSNKPLVERRVEYCILDTPTLKIFVFGTIDAVMHSEITGTFPADHKTTWQLGNDFFNRLHPNFQYTAYVLGARECLGIDTNTFMVNGIQVAKTKYEFTRQFTTRTEEDFQEFKASVIHYVKVFLQCMENDFFPMSTPDPCVSYGRCEFGRICEVPKTIQKNVIQTAYKSI